MCILCVAQKWSHKVSTMLPWFVIPLIGLWALSQLLPPGFRLEVTSPRLACVSVLLVTLSWYEILMPQLSAWRVRRNAFLGERKRVEALEKVKLRKMATKRCRNCLTPYRDQNPSGGKFMCSHCGQISKKPVLDVPIGLSESGIAKYGIIGGLVSKSGKLWAESENGCCGSFARKGKVDNRDRNNWRVTENSYLGIFDFALKLMVSFILSIKCLWRKIFMKEVSSGERLSSKVENEATLHESRGERSRRKAEEKRQARLEKELWEEEEKKQREEVAKLVEEQRKLKHEKMKSEKECSPREDLPPQRKKEKKYRKTEKDRGSSKSNSDAEDPERRSGLPSKECGKKQEFEKRHNKVSTSNYFSGANTTRYLDRMKGSFLSSSKSFRGSRLFTMGPQTSVNAVSRINNPSGSASHVQASCALGKSSSSVANNITKTSFNKLVHPDLQTWETPKKSWKQLFTRCSTASLDSNANTSILSESNINCPPMLEIPEAPYETSPTHPFNSHANIGQASPFTSSPFSPIRKLPFEFLPEETDLFEDPLYVPDQVVLPGPVSESFVNFPSDIGTGFVPGFELENPCALKSVFAFAEANHPSPIGSPVSQPQTAEEKHPNSSQSLYTQCNHVSQFSSLNESNNSHEHGAWRMWDTPQLGHDGLGLVSGPPSWSLPIGKGVSNQEPFSPALQNRTQNPLSNENILWLQRSVGQPFSSHEEAINLSFILGENFSRNEVAYGSPKTLNGSTDGHPFNLSSTQYKIDPALYDSVEAFGNPPSLARPSHIGGPYPSPDVHWSFN
ncbi:hypothetical protein GIB67_041172 [Kingdonia uniflora]|uniref:Uncharacterized protein n=1 Tax=Kingdonia uniflora TaxID=39325 RepID=A0A7J7LKP4_9MAGN|nr:hypothetical protein GIB67_041172 [Kingdonia uniflora]